MYLESRYLCCGGQRAISKLLSLIMNTQTILLRQFGGGGEMCLVQVRNYTIINNRNVLMPLVVIYTVNCVNFCFILKRL